MGTQFRGKDTATCRYGLFEAPADVALVTPAQVTAAGNGGDPISTGTKWTNERVPAIGELVFIRFNSLGYGRVTAYFIEHGFLGVELELDRQPEWHQKQNGQGAHALAFGAEVRLEAVPA